MKTTKSVHVVLDETDIAEAIFWYLKDRKDMDVPLGGADAMEITTTHHGVEVEWTSPETD